MKVVKPAETAFLARCLVAENRVQACLTLLVCFDLGHDGPPRLLPATDMWSLAAKSLPPGQVLDEGWPKPAAEFAVHGHCRPPEPVQAAEVRVAVGPVSKILTVLGDRLGDGTGWHSDPRFFEAMPLGWESAYGGPDFPDNPRGKGRVADRAGHLALPNLRPGPMNGPAGPDLPEPVSLAPYPPDQPSRLALLGRFDRNWLKSDWPHLPSDTDRDYFFTSPPDQRLPGFFQGREAIVLEGFRADRPTIRTTTPVLRPRVFCIRAEGGGEIFFEVPVRADSLTLFPDAPCGVLAFRGTCPAADDELDDLSLVAVFLEDPAGLPQPPEHYRRAAEEALRPPPAPLAPATPEPAPADRPEPAAAPPPEPAPPEVPGLAAALGVIQSALAEIEDLARAQLTRTGLAPADVQAAMTKAEAGLAAGTPPDTAGAASQLEALAKDQLARHGLDETALLASTGKPAEAGESVDALLSRAAASGAMPPEAAAMLSRAAKELDQAAGRISAEMTPPTQGAAPEAAGPTPSPDGKPDVKAVLDRLAGGRSLSGLDLSGLDFSGQNLAGADLSKAILAKTLFAGADLTGANLSGAVAEGADLSRAVLTGADLRRLDAPGARFAGAALSGVLAGEADLTGADLSGADLSEADLTGTILSGATLVDIAAGGLSAKKARFEGAALPRVLLSGAVLAEADFTGADLTGADLREADLTEARLQGARASGADFSKARLSRARADAATDFSGARFEAALMESAAFSGADLTGALLGGAWLRKASLSRCRLARADLGGIRARGAVLDRADLSGARLSGADLLFGSLRKANLTGADLTGANLFGVDLHGLRLGGARTDGANLGRTLIAVREET